MMEIIKKAWRWQDSYECQFGGVVHAESRDKARVKLWNKFGDCTFDSFIDMCKTVVIRRSKDDDLLAPIPLTIASELTEKQLGIISHMNGNYSDRPGYRNHYNLSDKSDPDMTYLASRNLVTEPQSFVDGNSFNWYLTKLGRWLADSLLPIARESMEGAQKRRKLVDKWLAMENLPYEAGERYPLELFKIRPDLIGSFKALEFYIHSDGGFWRPEGAGYTYDVERAGVFNFKDAYDFTSHCGEEKYVEYQCIGRQ